MYRYRVGDLRCRGQHRNIQVTVHGRRRPDANRFIGQQHVLEAAVGLGMHSDRLDIQFAAGTQNA